MADKEVLYRIEFEGAKEQLKVLADIREELDKIAVEQVKSDKSDKVRQEELKIAAKQQQEIYRKEQQAIKDKQKENKAVAGSLEQLRLEAKKLGNQLEKTWAVGTPEFKKAADGLEQINRKIRMADKSAGNFKSNIGNYAGSIGDAFQGIGVNVGGLTSSLGAASMATGPLGVGLVALTAGAQLFGKALTVTDDLADKFEETLGSVQAATTVFFTALATGNWSNFLGSMRDAITEGKRYTQTLDEIADRSRALEVQESDAGLALATLKNQLRDVTLSETERIKKADEYLKIEDELSTKRVKIARDELNNKLNNLAVTKGIDKTMAEDMIRNFENYKSQFKLIERLNELQDEVDATRDTKKRFGLQTQLDNVKALTAGYSDAVRAFGNLNEEERNKAKDLLVSLGNALKSFEENTGRVQVRRNALLKEVGDTAEKSFTTATTAAADLNKEVRELDKIFLQFLRTSQKLQRTYGSGLTKKAQSLTTGVGYSGQTIDTTGSVGGMRTGAGKPNLPPEPTKKEQNQAFWSGFDYNATADAASQFVNIWSDAYAEKDKALQEMLDKGQISEKEYQKESEKLQKRAANLQRVSVIAQLTGDIAKTLSALGVGAANTAKVGFPLNIPLMIAFAAQAVGIISNMRSIKFAEGGLIAGGKPHSQGGTKYVGDDGSAFEAERGEYIAVVNKHDTRRLSDLSNLNSRHGKSFYGQPQSAYFAQGGVFTPNQNIGAGNQAAMIRDMVKQIGSIPVEVSLDEIQRKTNTKRKVNVIGSL